MDRASSPRLACIHAEIRVITMMDRMMDGMMEWGWLLMLLGSALLVALIVLVVVVILRIAGKPR